MNVIHYTCIYINILNQFDLLKNLLISYKKKFHGVCFQTIFYYNFFTSKILLIQFLYVKKKVRCCLNHLICKYQHYLNWFLVLYPMSICTCTYKTARERLFTALKNKINNPGPRRPMLVISLLTESNVHLSLVIRESAKWPAPV